MINILFFVLDKSGLEDCLKLAYVVSHCVAQSIICKIVYFVCNIDRLDMTTLVVGGWGRRDID